VEAIWPIIELLKSDREDFLEYECNVLPSAITALTRLAEHCELEPNMVLTELTYIQS